MEERRVLVRDLDPAVSSWLKNLFGQEMGADQAVYLALPREGLVPGSPEWKEAWADVDQFLDEADRNMKDVSNEEFEAAVEEAIQAIRSNPTQ
jgi:hypothetical protein